MNKKKISIIFLISSVICLVVSIVILIYPTIYDYQCETRYVTELSYGTGSSGVVFASDEDRYYALTAYHVVKDFDTVEYIIVPYGVPTIEKYRENSDTHISNGMYYEQFSRAKVEFADESYDLAVISFESDEEINVLQLSETNPKYNEKIMVAVVV